MWPSGIFSVRCTLQHHDQNELDHPNRQHRAGQAPGGEGLGKAQGGAGTCPVGFWGHGFRWFAGLTCQFSSYWPVELLLDGKNRLAGNIRPALLGSSALLRCLTLAGLLAGRELLQKRRLFAGTTHPLLGRVGFERELQKSSESWSF